MRHSFYILSGLVIAATVCSPAIAEPSDWDDLIGDEGVVVDHAPLNTGGLAADTEFVYPGMSWQRVADDVLLGNAALIQRIVWWGFYAADNPPASEIMRVRFYGARTGDGLPDDDNILFEESFFNPSREATGRTVWVGVDPDEYIYEVELPTPFELVENTECWLEIVQIGDIDTRFRWEFSAADQNGQAFINPVTADWRTTAPELMADTAFQLLTIPEPSALGAFMVGIILAGRRRGRKEAYGGTLRAH